MHPCRRSCWLAIAVAALSVCVTAAPAESPGRYRVKTRTFHTPTEFARLTQKRVRLQRTLSPAAEAALRRLPIRLPVAQLTAVATAPDGTIWAATPHGAFRLVGAQKAVEYFAGERWLPDDRVTAIGFDGDATWLETPKGYVRIDYSWGTLAQKAHVFEERVQARHVRWGLTASSQLSVAGDLATSRTVSTDNDGLWTAMYVAAECFRYAVTHERDARETARRGMEALLRLESITGVPGFPARSFIRTGQDIQPRDGEWHDTTDRAWRWKGDTSSDEIVGHYFVYPIYDELVADDTEKARLRGVIERMTNHILDHNYQLIGPDGQRTQWGWWGPDEIWKDADETGLRALHILSHLRVAIHLTENAQFRARYERQYDDLVTSHKYALLTRNQKITVPGHINHSDDELAFLSYYPLLRYETDPTLLEIYRESLERSWRIERPERNPLWNAIYAVGSGAKEWDRDESLRTLREIPMDTISWTVRNSNRVDVPVDSMSDRFGHRQSLIVLPYDELPMSKWNGNPYNLDGGNDGRSEDDGAYFLLPYWMARYHKLIAD